MLNLSKPSILYCIPTLDGGGAERQLILLSNKLVDLGWSIHILLLRTGINKHFLRTDGIVIHVLPSASHYDPRLLLWIYRLIKDIRPALVQSWLPMMDILTGLVMRFFPGIPWIMTERNSKLAYPASLKNHLRKSLARSADAIIANSTSGMAYWAPFLKTNQHGLVIRNGLDLDGLKDIQPKNPSFMHQKQPDSSRFIVYAGRFVQQKNIINMIEAFIGVLKTHDVYFLLFGTGPLVSTAELMIEKQCLQDRIVIRPYTSDFISFLKSAYMFVSASYYEGMPNTVMEAMSCGCPIVVSDIEQHREILDEHGAIFVRPDECDSISYGIKTYLDAPDMARDHAFHAKALSGNFNISVAAQRYDSVYRSLINI